MQAGCPQAFGPVCGKETGVERERGWTVGQFSLCLQVLDWNPYTKFKRDFPESCICEQRKIMHISWFLGSITLEYLGI